MQVNFIILFTYFIIICYFDVGSFAEKKNTAHQIKLKCIYLFKITLKYNSLSASVRIFEVKLVQKLTFTKDATAFPEYAKKAGAKLQRGLC